MGRPFDCYGGAEDVFWPGCFHQQQDSLIYLHIIKRVP